MKTRFNLKTFFIPLLILTFALFCFTGVGLVLLNTITIHSSSMSPQLQEGYTLLINRRFTIEIGKVYGYKCGEKILVKRLTALPDSTIQCKNGIIYIDADRCSYGPAITPSFENWGPITLNQDDVFMMGDNRPFSSDSRSNGPVKINHIQYRVFMILYPLNRFGLVE